MLHYVSVHNLCMLAVLNTFMNKHLGRCKGLLQYNSKKRNFPILTLQHQIEVGESYQAPQQAAMFAQQIQ